LKIIDSVLVLSARSGYKLDPKPREKFRKRMPFVDAFLPTLSECSAVMA